jgi:hypothetical protein
MQFGECPKCSPSKPYGISSGDDLCEKCKLPLPLMGACATCNPVDFAGFGSLQKEGDAPPPTLLTFASTFEPTVVNCNAYLFDKAANAFKDVKENPKGMATEVTVGFDKLTAKLIVGTKGEAGVAPEHKDKIGVGDDRFGCQPCWPGLAM